MPRIRTIKPEFPQSESMGRISRDARLLFVQLWTLVDDSGRARGNSRMLASLLFPYDDDAPSLIDGWIQELVREDCIVHYASGGGNEKYIAIKRWKEHQRIDKPTKSKVPPPPEPDSESPREDSRTFAEPSQKLLVGPGPGRDQRTKGSEDRERERTALSPSRGSQEVPLTEDMLSDGFPEAWERWLRWVESTEPRRMPPERQEAVLMEMGRRGPAKAARDIDFSIERGFKNIRDSDDDWQKNSGGNQPGDDKKLKW